MTASVQKTKDVSKVSVLKIPQDVLVLKIIIATQLVSAGLVDHAIQWKMPVIILKSVNAQTQNVSVWRSAVSTNQKYVRHQTFVIQKL
jgi:hypothetical protein